MKQKQRVFVLIATTAVIATFLLMVLRPQPSCQPKSGPDPGTDNGEVAHTPAESIAVHRFGLPDEWYAAGAKGETYAGALAGEEFRADPTTGATLGQSPAYGPYLPNYVIGRAYVGWDTSALADEGEVLSATLILELHAGGGREEAFNVVVYQGNWTPPIGLDDWRSSGVQAVGRWQLPASRIEGRETLRTGQGVPLYAPEPARTVRVPLDPAVVEMDGATRLELRHAGEGVPPLSAEIVPLGPSQIRLEVKYRP